MDFSDLACRLLRSLSRPAIPLCWVSLVKCFPDAYTPSLSYSRNTAQKQWDETLVMYLNGMSRLLRSYFRLLEAMPDFDTAWSSYLQFVAESIAEGSKEVGIAAVSSIHTVLQAQASKVGQAC